MEETRGKERAARVARRIAERWDRAPAGEGGEPGFTLIEMVSALVIASILFSLAVTTYSSVGRTSRIQQAIVDIVDIQTRIDNYTMTNDAPPPTLAAVGKAGATDPWGRLYVYRPFPPSGPGGAARKDRFLVPLNTLYDLYSVGPDGLTAPSLRAVESADDVVRANDGSYVGLGSNY